MDLRLSLLAWSVLALQPFVDDGVAGFVRWNIVWKVRGDVVPNQG